MTDHVVAGFTKAAIQTAIGNANTEAGGGIEAVPGTVLRFPSGRYDVVGPLTPARGNYSILMAPGAFIKYTPTNTTPVTGTVNEKMWTIGSISPGGPTDRTIDGQGLLQFDLAAEQDQAGLTPFTDAYPNNLPFEFINISHCWITIRRASGFHTGLRMRAQGVGGEYRYMYDVTVNLGYLHGCFRHIVNVTSSDGWMNNIRYYNGNFAPSVADSRYINMLAEAGGGENKAVFHNILCDGIEFTAIYAPGGTAAVYGEHLENPQNNGAFPAGGVIEHPAGSVASEPSYWIGRSESKNVQIKDVVDHGSFVHDPRWGAARSPLPLLVTASRNITLGDIRRQSMLQTAAGDNTARALTMPPFAGEVPPIGSVVYVKRRGPGALTLVEGSNVDFIVPGGRKNNPVTLRAQGSEAVLRMESDASPRLWSVVGDLADA